MKPNAYDLDVAVVDEYIKLKWTLDSDISNPSAYRYPKLEVQFKFTNIAQDTVGAMLRNLEVPRDVFDSIMAEVAASAA